MIAAISKWVAPFWIIAAAATSGAQAAPSANRGTLLVRVGERSVALSRAELSALPRRTIRVGAGADTATLGGVALWDVLERAQAVPPAASGRQRAVMYVRLVGADGQTAVLALAEVDPSFSTRQVLLADQRSGKPLDDVEGPWRAITPDDLRHARRIRGLTTISVETMR